MKTEARSKESAGGSPGLALIDDNEVKVWPLVQPPVAALQPPGITQGDLIAPPPPPWCRACNPRPSPALTLDKCAACAEKDMRKVMRRLAIQAEAARQAALLGRQALKRLAKVLQGDSGQPLKLRALLFSFWNGQPASMTLVLDLDRTIREDLASFLLGFGHETLFYDELEKEVRAVGRWEWFLEQSEDVGTSRAYVQAAKGRGK